MQTQIFSDTYEMQIAGLFKAGKTVTVLSVLKEVHTLELRKFVSRLKRKGMDIKSQWVTAPNGKRFKEYSLNQTN